VFIVTEIYLDTTVIEITHRLQTARPTVRQLLFRYLLPWLCNMELVDPNLPPMSSGYSYPTYCADLGRSATGVVASNMAGDANDTGNIRIVNPRNFDSLIN
jgi:hypothetical protein